MEQLVLAAPQFGFIIGTRIALAFGLGLLVGERLPEARRRALAYSLVSIGIATTVPAALTLLSSRRITSSPVR
jgi:hypothetical protein